MTYNLIVFGDNTEGMREYCEKRGMKIHSVLSANPNDAIAINVFDKTVKVLDSEGNTKMIFDQSGVIASYSRRDRFFDMVPYQCVDGYAPILTRSHSLRVTPSLIIGYRYNMVEGPRDWRMWSEKDIPELKEEYFKRTDDIYDVNSKAFSVRGHFEEPGTYIFYLFGEEGVAAVIKQLELSAIDSQK